jgi:hypothetical protein
MVGTRNYYYHLHRIRSLSHIIHRVSKNPLTIKCNENKRASKGPDHIREIDGYYLFSTSIHNPHNMNEQRPTDSIANYLFP